MMRMPGARPLLWFGLVGRFPNSMVPVGLVFAVEAITGSYGLAGSASAGFSLAGAVAKPIGGRLVDRYGQRLAARSLLVAFVGCAVGLLVAISAAATPGVIVLLSVAAGLTAPNIGALTRVRWTRLTGADDMPRWQALESANDEINFIVGPTAVAAMAAWFTASASLVAATVLAVAGTLGVTSLPGEPRSGRVSRRRAKSWIRPIHLAVLGSVGGLGMVLGGMSVTVIAYTAELGYPAWSAVIFPLNAGASLAAALVLGRIGPGDLVSQQRRSTFWLLLVLLPYGFGGGIGWFTVTAMIAGLGTSPNLIHANSLAVATIPPERRTEALSWIAAAAGIGIAAGSAITGVLVDAIGADAARLSVTAFGACPAAMTVAMILTGGRKGHR